MNILEIGCPFYDTYCCTIPYESNAMMFVYEAIS